MRSENKFINELQKEVEKKGLMGDVKLLFRLERDKGRVATTLAILNLIPALDGAEKISNLSDKVYKLKIESVRERFSRDLLDLMRKLQPDALCLLLAND